MQFAFIKTTLISIIHKGFNRSFYGLSIICTMNELLYKGEPIRFIIGFKFTITTFRIINMTQRTIIILIMICFHSLLKIGINIIIHKHIIRIFRIDLISKIHECFEFKYIFSISFSTIVNKITTDMAS